MRELSVVLLAPGVDPAVVAAAEAALENRGFEVFTHVSLGPDSPEMVPAAFRGGGHALIAFNELMAGGSGATGAGFADFEVEKAAHLLAATVPEAAQYLRVTADSALAARLAEGLLPQEELARLAQTIAARKAAMASEEPVIADLSRFKYRAKVELVRWNGQTAIKKTFRRSGLDAMARELAFHEDMCPVSEVPPRVLARTSNAIVFEHIDNALEVRRLLGLRVPVPLPFSVVRQLAEFVHLVVARGWDPIDLTPRDNILIDRRSGGLRAIDFEFAFRHERPVTPEASYFLAGVPADASVARPLNNAMQEDPFPGKWRPFVGLDKHSFLHDPPWLQRLKRMVVHPPWLAARVMGALLRRRRHATARDEALSRIILRAS